VGSGVVLMRDSFLRQLRRTGENTSTDETEGKLRKRYEFDDFFFLGVQVYLADE
jgi:hypothetical protein